MKSSRLTLWLIIFLTILGVFINLPSSKDLPIDTPFLKSEKLEIQFAGRVYDLSFLTLPNLTGLFPIRLGLDLQGGTELVLLAKMDDISDLDRDSALESVKQVIERRVNLYGVSEAIIQTSKVGSERRILVELPGVKDLETAVNLVGRTAKLEFREVLVSPSAEASATAIINLETTKLTNLTGADLKKSSVVFGSSQSSQSTPQVQIEFSPQGGEKFSQITARNIGRPLAIFVDDMPISAPMVQQEIIGGVAVISGGFTTSEAKNLSIQLNAGALPVPIKILEQRTISATLGQQSINNSLIASMIGLLAVMIYVVTLYGIYGLLADLALILYTILVLAIFRTGLFLIPPVTLTLAGIAGFILSIGMAVDANILTFERMKEELRSGKKGRLALETGFNRSWSSIRDSNVSSIITGVILYIFGTSIVRGFALTLIIGVLVSMFSAVVVTRTFLRLQPKFRN